MDQVIIPPATAGTTGFIAGHGENHHGGHHGGDHDWPSRTAERVKDVLALNATERSEQTRDILGAVGAHGAANSLATEKIGAAGILATEKTAAAGMLEAVKNSAAVQLVVEKTAAAAALLAAQNHAAALAQAAECCCSLKEAISADGQKTRELINQNERERMQARIVALERLLPTAI